MLSIDCRFAWAACFDYLESVNVNQSSHAAKQQSGVEKLLIGLKQYNLIQVNSELPPNLPN